MTGGCPGALDSVRKGEIDAGATSIITVNCSSYSVDRTNGEEVEKAWLYNDLQGQSQNSGGKWRGISGVAFASSWAPWISAWLVGR